MKCQSTIFILLGLAIGSCQGTKSLPASQKIYLTVGSKQITDVVVDTVKVDLSSSDAHVYPLVLTEGSHLISWRVGADHKKCGFEVGMGEGDILIHRKAPLVETEGSVKVKVQPK